MQTASQRAFNQTPEAGGQRPAKKKRSVRAGTMAAISITWKKLNPDIDGDDLRNERLKFITGVLKLKKPLESMRGLKDQQLGRVIDEMRLLERAPTLPGTAFRVPASAGPFGRDKSPTEVGTLNAADGAEIHHLATAYQVEAIDKLFAFLSWTPAGVEGFMQRNFKRNSHRLLTPKQAQSCTFILLRIGAQKSVKQSRQVERVSNVMIREEIPRLKVRLGIDVRKLTTEDRQIISAKTANTT